MCERRLFHKLDKNYQEIVSRNGQYFCVKENIKMSFKLIDTKIIQGVYIDRNKNISKSYYTVDE